MTFHRQHLHIVISKKIGAWLLIFSSAAPLSRAYADMFSERESAAEYKESSDLNRTQRPTQFYLSFGTPAPAIVALSVGSQLNSDLQLLISYGQFWANDLRIHSVGPSIRTQLFPTDFTPFVGAGVNALFFRGRGQIQTLDESSLLLSLVLGIDWAMSNGPRFSAGYSFHVPLRLNFPFVDLGWSF